MQMSGLDKSFLGVIADDDNQRSQPLTPPLPKPRAHRAELKRVRWKDDVLQLNQRRGVKSAKSSDGTPQDTGQQLLLQSVEGRSARSCTMPEPQGARQGPSLPYQHQYATARSQVPRRASARDLNTRMLAGIATKQTYRCRKCGQVLKGHSCPMKTKEYVQ